MSQLCRYSGSPRSKAKGMTLIEALAVIAIVIILSALAAPWLRKWQESIVYRDAARRIVYRLREARSRAIAMNREHRVEFEVANNRFGMRPGDRARNTSWKAVPPVLSWDACSPPVILWSNVTSIQFNPNGTANGGTIKVNDDLLNTRYEIIVHRTGRIRSQ